MKKKLSGIVIFIILSIAVMSLCSCGSNENPAVTQNDLLLYYIENTESSRELVEKSSYYNESAGRLELTLDSETEEYDFYRHFKSLETKTKWSLYLDKMGLQEVPTKIVTKFANGENLFYITVFSLDDTILKNYEIRIYKEYNVQVTFRQKNGTNIVVGNEAFEGFLKQIGATWTSDGVYTIPGDTVLAEVPLYKEKGYTFNGWYCGETAAKGITLTENMEFTADLTPNKYYFTLNADGGRLPEGQSDSVQLEYDSNYTLPVPEREGYSFTGWALGRNDHLMTDGQGVSLDKLTITDDSELIAKWAINSYGVMFVTENAEFAGEVTVTIGDITEKYVPFEKDGGNQYHFKADYGKQIKFAVTPSEKYTYISMTCDGRRVDPDNFVIPAKDVVIEIIYAQYGITVIGSDPEKGTVAGEGAYTAGTDVTLTAFPKTGYLFVAWKKGGETVCETAEYNLIMPKENLVLTVEWKPVAISATLKAENDTQDRTVSLVYDQSFNLYVPEKYGYDFTGWKDSTGAFITDNNGTGLALSRYTENVILTAGWNAKPVKISFDLQGGNGEPVLYPVNTFFGSDISAQLSAITVTRRGYNFTGWKLTGEDGLFDGMVDFAYDVTLVAQWKAITVTLRLHEEKQGEMTGTAEVTYDEDKALGIPVRMGYIFEGWRRSADDSVLTGKDGILVKSEFIADADVYAEWTAVTVGVTFEGADLQPGEIIYGKPYTFVPAAKTGYNFGGWMCEGIPVTGENGVSLKVSAFIEDVTFTAVWTPVDVCIKLNTAEGVLTEGSDEVINCKYDGKFILPAATKTGYIFGGWESAAGKVYEAGREYTVDFADELEVTAVWTAKEILITYQVEADATISAASQKVTFGKQANLLIPERPGYKFNGWKNASDNAVVCGADGVLGIVGFAEPVTLKAEWIPLSATATLEPNGGELSGEKSVLIEYNKPFTLEVPVYEGNAFVGWYFGDDAVTDADGHSLSDSDFTGNVQFVAKWKPADVKITLNADGGTLSKTTVDTYFGAENVALGVPEKYGYVFTGWKNGSSIITGSDGIFAEVTYKSSVTLTASYEKRKFSITVVYDKNQGSVTGAGLKSYQSTATLTATPAAGFGFIGWYDKDENLLSTGSPYSFVVDKNVTITAKFDSGGTPVKTADDLKNMTSDGKYILANDITLPSDWEPLTFEGGFTGTLNGNGHRIMKFTKSGAINNDSGADYAYGLFNTIGETGIVKNINFESVNLSFETRDSHGTSFVAGTVAAYNYGTIENCRVTGTIKAAPYYITDDVPGRVAEFKNYYLGGLCGENYGKIKYSSSSVAIEATDTCTASMYISALVAHHKDGEILGCYAAGAINSNYNKEKSYLYIGQIAAFSGDYTATNKPNIAAKIYDCKAAGSIDITAHPDKEELGETNQIYVGGILARAVWSEIVRTYSAVGITADISGNIYAGQIAGSIYKETAIENSFASGSVDVKGKQFTTEGAPTSTVKAGYICGENRSTADAAIVNGFYANGMQITAGKFNENTGEYDPVAIVDDSAVAKTANESLFRTELSFGIYDAVSIQQNPNNVWLISGSSVKLFIEQ